MFIVLNWDAVVRLRAHRTMKYLPLVFIILAIACALPSGRVPNTSEVRFAVANKFIDAFYSFDADTLRSILSDAPASHREILYYQKWAECAHYKILNRGDFVEKNDSTILCPITVKDDLMAALQLDLNVTDTFHVSIRDGRIRSITTSSNDPALYYEAKEWVKTNKPEYVEVQCINIWQGGPTPCECVQGMVKGFGEFVKK